jgi:hypothetical protein
MKSLETTKKGCSVTAQDEALWNPLGRARRKVEEAVVIQTQQLTARE